jgi:flagellin
MVIQNNIPAMNAGRYLGVNTGLLGSSLEKLSSGYKINRAGDNAAGLAVSEKMRSQMSGIDQAIRNAGDGISMIQTFEGALTESHSILNRIKTLAAQSANGTYTDETDRAAIELEYNQLVQELDDISQTDFNGVIVMAKGGTVLRGRTEKRTVHHDAAMTPSSGVNASVTGLDKLSADETVNVTAGRPTVTASNAKYEIDISGAYTEYGALHEEWDYSFVTEPTINATAGASITIRDGSTLSITAGTYTSAQFIQYLLDNANTLGFHPGDYTLTKGSEVNAGTVRVNTVNIKAVSAGGLWHLTGSLFDNATITGLTGFSSGGSNLVTKGRNASDGALNIFGESITLNDGNDINYIRDSLQQSLNVKYSTGTYNVSTSGNRLTVTKAAAGVDTNAAALSSASDREASGLTFSVLTETAGVDYAAAVTPTITTSGWALQTDGSYKKGDTYITLGATTGGGSITLKAAYDTLEDVYVPASVVNADSVSLQVGSRTKDLKKYDFTYSQVWSTMTNPANAQISSIGALVADVSVTAAGLGLVTATVNLASQSNANTALDKIDNAINKVSMIRNTFGSIQNRLDHKIDNLGVTNENINAAESRIRDTDMAAEMMLFTKRQIILQASQSMLAQANQLPSGTLQLLQ